LGEDSEPNTCDDLACSDLGGGAGQCTTGPDDLYCDGFLHADGSGIFACTSNGDCDSIIVGVGAGDCALTERRKCFTGTVSATGSPDPQHPVAVDTHCLAGTANVGVNIVVGLPGAVRSVAQQELTSFCSTNPATAYTPGGGSCP